MKLAGGFLQYELYVGIGNECTEQSVKNKNKILTNKKDKPNKDYLLLFFFIFKIIQINKIP